MVFLLSGEKIGIGKKTFPFGLRCLVRQHGFSPVQPKAILLALRHRP
jgi:hypothetical protein